MSTFFYIKYFNQSVFNLILLLANDSEKIFVEQLFLVYQKRPFSIIYGNSFKIKRHNYIQQSIYLSKYICAFIYTYTHIQIHTYITWKYVFNGYSINHLILKLSINQSLCKFLQFSRSVVSNSLRPHESQHVRPPLVSV